MTKLSFFQKIALWLAGYDTKTAQMCTSSAIQPMTVAGSMVLIPAIVGLFSYGYGFYFLFQDETIAAIGGFVAAVVVLLIDRSIMAYGRPGHFSLGLLGRAFLALTIGFILAEPLVLKVFEDSIAEQQENELTQLKEAAAIPYDEKVQGLKESMIPQQDRLYQLQQDYTNEMDGTGGSGIRNQGPIYKRKYADYLKQDTLLTEMTKTVNENIAQVELEKQQKLASVEAANANGLIGRMRALHTLGQQEPIVLWSTWLLRGFFILIELIPLLIKISPSGSRGLYYELADGQEEERFEVFKAGSDARKAIVVKEEELLNAAHLTALYQKEVELYASSKQKDTLKMMDYAIVMSEKKVDFKYRASKNIRDEELLQKVYGQLDAIYDGYIKVLEDLNDKSNRNFSPKNS